MLTARRLFPLLKVRALFAHLSDYPPATDPRGFRRAGFHRADVCSLARWRKALNAKEGPKLVAVTVDHGLRPEAQARGDGGQETRARRSRIEHTHAALDRREAQDRNSGGRARRALSPCSAQVGAEAPAARHPDRAHAATIRPRPC